jgi:hypothetical protein
MPESYFQLSRQSQASALDAASAPSGRAPYLLEKDIRNQLLSGTYRPQPVRRVEICVRIAGVARGADLHEQCDITPSPGM